MSNQPPPYEPPYQGPPQDQGAQQGYPGPPQQYPGQPPYQGPPYQGQPYQGQPPYGHAQYAAPPPPPQYGPGQQFGWGPGGFPPPPKEKSKAPWVIGGLVLVFAGVASLWIVGVVMKSNRHNDTVTQPLPTPSYQPTTAAPTYEPTTAPTTAPQPTATRTTKTTPPPPPPPSDSDILTKNSLYKTGVQRTVNCKESSARANSAANARQYYNAVLACLNRAWPRHLALAGHRFEPPTLIAFTGPVQTPCTSNAPSSFYCSSNRTIYMDAGDDVAHYKRYSGFNNRTEVLTLLRVDMVAVVAHEYGHHLQHLTGILRANSNIEYQRSGDAALQMSRRLEIQATCLGNVFMGANKGSYKFTGLMKSKLDWRHANQGDEYGPRRDHGSKAVIPRWAKAGFNTRSPRVCNTYTAPAALVR